MKFFFLSLPTLFVVVLLGACRKEPAPVECAGNSDYFIRNESTHPLAIIFLTTPQLGSNIDSSKTVAAGQEIKIAETAMIGYIPTPKDTFSELIFFRQVNGSKVVALRQNPVRDERWVKLKNNPADPDVGCYRVRYTLIVTGADIQ